MRGDRAQDGSGVSIIATLEKLQQAAGTGVPSAAAFSRPGYDLTRMRLKFRGLSAQPDGAHEKR